MVGCGVVCERWSESSLKSDVIVVAVVGGDGQRREVAKKMFPGDPESAGPAIDQTDRGELFAHGFGEQGFRVRCFGMWIAQEEKVRSVGKGLMHGKHCKDMTLVNADTHVNVAADAGLSTGGCANEQSRTTMCVLTSHAFRSSHSLGFARRHEL